jgi:5'-nucleotidase (lipoprotein e(P4) family)
VRLEHHKGGVRTKIALAAVLLTGCAGAPLTTPTTVPPEAHEELDSVLWVRTSPEYEAVCREIFALAELRLDEALDDPTWSASLEQPSDYGELPPAVILDVDETVLDNSAFEARLIAEGVEYGEPVWSSWVAEEAATAVPGARDFIRLALERGVAVFFVTNRNHDTEEHTVRNLQQHFGPGITGDQVLTRHERAEWTSDKTSRRGYIASTHRVLLLVGDDLNDFIYSGNIPQQARLDYARRYSEYWGEKWIILPNPMYGSWEQALYGSGPGLERVDKLRLKRESLDLSE